MTIFSASRFGARIAAFGARTATFGGHIATALAITLVGLGGVALSTAPAEARAQRGTCEIYKGTRRIDQNSCLAREICYYNSSKRGETCRTEYLWPTNATTLVTYDGGQPTLVNGAPARSKSINGMRCATNTVSGNTFCYRPGR